MDDLVNYLSAHPVILVILAAAALFFIYILFREMLKLILITGLIVVVFVLIALYGYYHYTGSEKFSETARETVERIGDQRERASSVGKAVVEKAKYLAEKVREAIQAKDAPEEE